jgi:putative tryptophan/tyrosine transport system substrate-binding protein
MRGTTRAAAGASNALAPALWRGRRPTMPIVFVAPLGPGRPGLRVEPRAPGGNITGFVSFEFSIGGKWVDLPRQVVRDLRHVTAIFSPDTSQQSNFLLPALGKDPPSLGCT